MQVIQSHKNRRKETVGLWVPGPWLPLCSPSQKPQRQQRKEISSVALWHEHCLHRGGHLTCPPSTVKGSEVRSRKRAECPPGRSSVSQSLTLLHHVTTIFLLTVPALGPAHSDKIPSQIIVLRCKDAVQSHFPCHPPPMVAHEWWAVGWPESKCGETSGPAKKPISSQGCYPSVPRTNNSMPGALHQY